LPTALSVLTTGALVSRDIGDQSGFAVLHVCSAPDKQTALH